MGKLTDEQKKAVINTGADIISKIDFSKIKLRKKKKNAPAKEEPKKEEPKKEEPKKVEPKKPNYLFIIGGGVIGLFVLGSIVYLASNKNNVSKTK